MYRYEDITFSKDVREYLKSLKIIQKNFKEELEDFFEDYDKSSCIGGLRGFLDRVDNSISHWRYIDRPEEDIKLDILDFEEIGKKKILIKEIKRK